MNQSLKEFLGLLGVILILTLAGTLGAFGRSCQNDIQYGIRGTIDSFKGTAHEE